MFKLPHEGPPAHAGLLKCVISLGHRGTPDFWVEQFKLLGPPYGALIFRGLMEHGLANEPYVPGRLEQRVREVKHQRAEDIFEAVKEDLLAFSQPSDDIWPTPNDRMPLPWNETLDPSNDE